ncbi:hypothetical protein LUZ63_012241 [Rhynchospora breviuscula]|uniref:NB-ARC domain-containing protein n=1 Tax=Rhynchospora breviuscula TaxID=2022672 RepID=A0A9Q0CKF1_9POAL|nr:hypothetical protein LUZ63_012241 [Rhynchospora breviuscula]
MDSLITFLSNTATSAITAVCIEPISRNITYPFKVSDNVKALEVATSRLDSKQVDVKNRVDMEELQGLTIMKDVDQWFTDVKGVIGEVVEIKKRYDERSRCLGSRSFNCWSNYRISKDTAKKLTEVQGLYDRGSNFEEVATRLPPRVQALPVGSEAVSTEVVGLQEILRYIDNDQYNIIGIWGMGGVGKTHLLGLVHDHYKRSSAFDSVIFVTASKECSIEKLQEELCKKYSFGQGTDVESQATIISTYLSNRNFLILLDDVWEQIDLQRVGIPFPLGLVNQFRRKVVITTRSSVVCGQMDVQKSHKVAGLDDEKALCLFNKMVGDETINSHHLIKSLAIKVVKELDGLPLALKTIGRSMHGKKNPSAWDHAIDLLQKSHLHEIEACREEDKIYNKLKLSYDSLKTSELQDCFLACSLWPEDRCIDKTELIECWMGLGLLDASDAENPYNPGHILIEDLLSACLLEEGGTNYSSTVKMHDVIRDMALWLAHDSGKTRDKWIVRRGVGVNQVLHQQDRWCHVERATLMDTMGSQHLVDEFIPCDANKLHFLMVRNFTEVEPRVKNMGFFCTLAFLDLSHCGLISFPQDISKLVNLRHLNLSGNKISSVPEDLKHVRNLRNLFLGYNHIASFPLGVISELKELFTIDLFMNKISVEDLTWLIKEITCLRKIRSVCVTLQHATQFRSILESSYFPIRSLELNYVNETDIILIPSSFIENSAIQNNLYELVLRGKSDKIEMKGSQMSYCQLKYLELLTIDGMEMLEEISWQNLAPKDLFPRLSRLYIGNCAKLKNVSWILYLPCLQSLFIDTCENIIQLIEPFDSAASATQGIMEMLTPTFPSLKLLILRELPKLQIICEQSIMFPSLEEIVIDSCPRLKKLPFRSNTVPSNLRSIVLEKEIWENLEWEDNDLKQALQPLTHF